MPRPESPLALRLVVSVWIALALHFATNISRELYPALTLAERGTLAVDEYVGLHPDIFVAPNGRAFINNNPGASVVAAVPLVLARPLLSMAEAAGKRRQATAGPEAPADYNDPRPNRQRFFRETRERGLDLKFGVAAVVSAVGVMAPATALLAWLMFVALSRTGMSAERSASYAALSVFATPVFFRAAYLNHNHLLGIAVFASFVLLWQGRATPRTLALGGALAALGVTMDYSGVVPAAFLGWWAIMETPSPRGTPAGPADWPRRVVWFGAGAAPPLLLLLGYQWWAFGSPFTLPQTLMPTTQYSIYGYSGMSLPQADLIWANLFDLRFGLFAFGPLLLLAIPGAVRWRPNGVTGRQTITIAAFFVGFLLFCSANQFARLQWNTGLRYLLPLVPFCFLFAVPVLERMPAVLRRWILVAAVAESWALAMARESVPESLVRVFVAGPELPWLTVIGKTAASYVPFLQGTPSPLAVLAVGAAAILAIWWPLRPTAVPAENQ
ncbi:MAG: hypothetical protein U0P30_06035 [Vicinamibacterales bacterium]